MSESTKGPEGVDGSNRTEHTGGAREPGAGSAGERGFPAGQDGPAHAGRTLGSSRATEASDRQERGARTRDALVSAARREFGTHGFADSSVEEIVARAGVTKGAFYHHFGGKKAIFERVFRQVKKELSRAAFVTHERHIPFEGPSNRSEGLRDFVRQSNTQVWQELERSCRRYVDLHTDPRMRRIVLIDARWVLEWDERERIEAEYGTVLLRADLRRARTRGLLPPDLPVRTTSVLLAGALNEACMIVVHADDRSQALDQAMSVIQGFLVGLRARSFEGGLGGP